MKTCEAIEALVSVVSSRTVYVSSLGRTSEELFRCRPDDTLFVDSMGDVTGISLGVAVGAGEVPVVGVDTDGSFLMNLSVLPALASLSPTLPNHRLVIIDNGLYESGGGRESRTCPLEWPTLFAAVGLRAVVAEAPEEVTLGADDALLICRVTDDEPPGDAMKTVDGVESSYRIEKALAQRRGRAVRRPARKA